MISSTDKPDSMADDTALLPNLGPKSRQMLALDDCERAARGGQGDPGQGYASRPFPRVGVSATLQEKSPGK